jgi:hypothetical protein
MSYAGMLRHRCEVLRLTETFLNGSPIHSWTVVAGNIPCFVDLNFVRLGKDPTWTPEAGRPTTRTGVGFFGRVAPIRSGDRLRMTKGPSGVFAIEAAIDEAWQPERRHHLEVSLKEVPQSLHTSGEATTDYSYDSTVTAKVRSTWNVEAP